jgi:hypothetical protein
MREVGLESRVAEAKAVLAGNLAGAVDAECACLGGSETVGDAERAIADGEQRRRLQSILRPLAADGVGGVGRPNG